MIGRVLIHLHWSILLVFVGLLKSFYLRLLFEVQPWFESRLHERRIIDAVINA